MRRQVRRQVRRQAWERHGRGERSERDMLVEIGGGEIQVRREVRVRHRWEDTRQALGAMGGETGVEET